MRKISAGENYKCPDILLLHKAMKEHPHAHTHKWWGVNEREREIEARKNGYMRWKRRKETAKQVAIYYYTADITEWNVDSVFVEFEHKFVRITTDMCFLLFNKNKNHKTRR